MTTNFETESCTRCGGTGQHSFNGEHSICYKCDGKNNGMALTKRGRAAKDYYLAKFEITAKDVKVGDIIRTNHIKQLTAVAVSVVPSNARYLKDGVMVQAPDQVLIEGLKQSIKVSPDSAVRRIPTKEENDAAIQDALAYQQTLTKAGTPRKR